jgi:hypothetical protein
VTRQASWTWRRAGTIGLILCAEKNEAVARYSVLHENENIFAARYVTCLPSVEEVEREITRERQMLEAGEGGTGGRGRRSKRRSSPTDPEAS